MGMKGLRKRHPLLHCLHHTSGRSLSKCKSSGCLPLAWLPRNQNPRLFLYFSCSFTNAGVFHRAPTPKSIAIGRWRCHFQPVTEPSKKANPRQLIGRVHVTQEGEVRNAVCNFMTKGFSKSNDYCANNGATLLPPNEELPPEKHRVCNGPSLDETVFISPCFLRIRSKRRAWPCFLRIRSMRRAW